MNLLSFIGENSAAMFLPLLEALLTIRRLARCFNPRRLPGGRNDDISICAIIMTGRNK
jgi:hypothetical protein